MAEYPALEGAGDPVNVRVELVKDVPAIGRVVGPATSRSRGRSCVPGSSTSSLRCRDPTRCLRATPTGSRSKCAPAADGQFAFRGLPPGLTLNWYEVRHPEFQTFEGGQPPLKGEEPSKLKLEPGCKVAGSVVDEQGRPIASASVTLRKPGSSGYEFETHTTDDGRFRLGGVKPGRWMVVIQPERNAPVFGPVVAAQDRPVENQYVAGPSSYISGKVIGPDGKPVARAAVGWARPIDEQGDAVASLELGRMTDTAEDGTFRLGPLSQGEFRLTSVVSEPRRLGRTKAHANQTNVIIRLEPDATRIRR